MGDGSMDLRRLVVMENGGGLVTMICNEVVSLYRVFFLFAYYSAFVVVWPTSQELFCLIGIDWFSAYDYFSTHN